MIMAYIAYLEKRDNCSKLITRVTEISLNYVKHEEQFIN